MIAPIDAGVPLTNPPAVNPPAKVMWPDLLDIDTLHLSFDNPVVPYASVSVAGNGFVFTNSVLPLYALILLLVPVKSYCPDTL